MTLLLAENSSCEDRVIMQNQSQSIIHGGDDKFFNEEHFRTTKSRIGIILKKIRCQFHQHFTSRFFSYKSELTV